MTFLELFPLVAAFRWPVVTLFGWLATALFTGLEALCFEEVGLGTTPWTGHLLDIHWLARGMRWSSLLFELRNSVLQFGFPGAIVLQLGKMTFLAFKGVALQNAMREDLQLAVARCEIQAVLVVLAGAEDLEEFRGSGQS
uniref:Uncharacterized protein n=1 Tax=Sphaerodactylus townsendi TaxID=933632 RepID=A0ACB8FJT9_9SAUR